MVDAIQSWSFGTLLRRYRIAAGWTQEELAERAGVSVRRLGDLERGVPHLPRRDTVALLAQALGLSPQDNATFVDARRRLASAGPVGIPARGACSGGGLATPPFVGRTPELALLERHVMGQGPPLLAIAGEPGMGKTRLLHAAIPRAFLHGLQVLEGGCQRRGGQAPFAPLLDALQHHIRSRRPTELRRDLRGCAWLVRLLPELADGPIEPLPAWTLPPAQERRLMGAAVARYLGNVAGPQGTLLVLDDLQWADPDALALLATLVRAATEMPLRVIGAYRDTEVQPQDPLDVLLADLAQAGLATHRLLAPLGKGEATHLLEELLAEATEVDGALRDGLLQRAGGVPFFLVSFVQSLWSSELAAGGAGEDSDHVRDRVPWDVAQSIRQRVAALPDGAAEVLGMAAVLGRTIQPAVLSAVAEQDEGAVLAALEAAGQARLLEEAVEQRLRFAHDVIREVVEADLGTARRTVLHRRIAQALEGGEGVRPVEALAYHYARGDVPDKALIYLEQAGDQAQRHYAHASAEGYYREALQHLDALGQAEDAARVREKLAPTLYLAARYDVALRELERAVAAYQAAGDREGVWRSLAQIGRMHAARGAAEEGLARLQPAVPAVAEAAPSRGAAVLWAALAWLLIADNQWQACIEASERAADHARAVTDDVILVDVEVRRGEALRGLGRLHDARQAMEAVLPQVETTREPTDALFRILLGCEFVYKHQGDFDRCRRSIDRALVEAERLDISLDRQWALARRGELLFLHGDWSAARACLEQAVALIPDTGWWLMAGEALVHLARLHLALGDGLVATRYLEDEHLRCSAKWKPSVRRLLAERDLEEGRAAAALARLTTDDGGAEWQDAVLLAWAYLELDDLRQAAALLAQVLTRAHAECDCLTLVDALRIQGLMCLRQRRWEDAAHSLTEGLLLARRLPYPYAEARLLQALGEVQAGRGEPLQARECLQDAQTVFGRLGAQRDSERMEQALAMLQDTPRTAPMQARPSHAEGQRGRVVPNGTRLSRSDRQTWALAHLRTAGPLSPRVYAQALGVSVDTALLDLRALVEQGLVYAEGQTKKRRYLLRDDET